MRRFAVVLLLLGFATATSHAFAAETSDDLGGVFDDIGQGARPLGMGDAFTAVADDANAADENPAGMAFFKSDQRFVTLTHSDLYSLGFLNRDYVVYAQGDEGYGALAVSWNQLSANLDPGNWDEDSFEYAGAKQVAAFGDDDWAKLAVGWQLKYLRINTSLADDSVGTGVDSGGGGGATTLNTSVSGGNAYGWGSGLGAMLKLGDAWAVGLAAQDLYSTVTYGTGTQEIIPMTTRLGVAYHPNESSVFSAEARGQQLSDGFGASSYHAGGEYWLLDGKQMRWNIVRNIAVRAGYYQVLYNGDGGVLTGGLTLKSDMWSVDYTYEYDASGGLGDTQRFGLDLQF